jgi:uncharacterized protein (DUF4415 family)
MGRASGAHVHELNPGGCSKWSCQIHLQDAKANLAAGISIGTTRPISKTPAFLTASQGIGRLPYGSAGSAWSHSVDAAQPYGSSASAKRMREMSTDVASRHAKLIIPDDDIPELADAGFAAAKSLKAEMREVVAAMKRGRGRPKVESPKERVSLRLDEDRRRLQGDRWRLAVAYQ